MNRYSIIVFHWTNKNGSRGNVSTTGMFFKTYAIELLEDEAFDRVFNTYYTIDDKITHKLDYYNTEL